MRKLKKKFKRYLNKIAQSHVKLRPKIRNFLKLCRKIKYLKLYLFNKIDNNLIIFESFSGKSYSDSPKALYKEMLNNPEYNNFKFVWAFKRPNTKIEMFEDTTRTKFVVVNSKQYYKTYAKAKYWIVNSVLDERLMKKKKQICVQCWHGTPLKKIRCDVEIDGSKVNTLKEQIKRNNMDVKQYNYLISPSRFASKKFISAFNLKKLNKEDIIIEEGYPRNEFLFNYTKKDVSKIKKQLKIRTRKKIILYAPTFRDNQYSPGVGYTYDFGIDLDKLKEEIGDDYIILFRTHYFVANSIDFSKYKKFIYDVSKYDDVNDLYVISDFIITDYSSVFFDYANLKRPMLFYMYDFNRYKNDIRGLYLDLKELPGPIIKTEKDLIKEIKGIDNYWHFYKTKYEKFNKKFNYLDGNNVSQKVLAKILEKRKL